MSEARWVPTVLAVADGRRARRLNNSALIAIIMPGRFVDARAPPPSARRAGTPGLVRTASHVGFKAAHHTQHRGKRGHPARGTGHGLAPTAVVWVHSIATLLWRRG